MKKNISFEKQIAGNSIQQIISTLLDRGGGLIFTIIFHNNLSLL